nr:hypothetical protein [Sphingopyxis sp. PET50]
MRLPQPGGGRRVAAEPALRPADRRAQPVTRDGLQQIVDRFHLERPGGKSGVGRHKDDGGTLPLGKAFEKIETVEAGHGDVEQHKIGLQFPDHFDGPARAGGGLDQPYLVHAPQRSGEAAERQRFVIDEQCAQNPHDGLESGRSRTAR